MVDFRCPKPAFFCRVHFGECQSLKFPCLQVCGSIHFYAIGGMCAISIVDTILEQDIWVGQWCEPIHIVVGKSWPCRH